MGLKVELGGGTNPRGDGFVNVDQCPTADIVFDFETLAAGARLPFADDAADEVYSSHAFEHVRALVPLVRETVRIAQVGARVEIRVPHWLSSMACCHGHVQTISPEQVEHWTRSAVGYWLGDSSKRLRLVSDEHVPGGAFERWRRLLPHASARDILDLCPGACHEVRWVFEVTRREG